MDLTQLLVILGSALLLAGLAWYFFGPKKATEARLTGGVQEVEITVRGSYSPDVIRLVEGVPARLVFDRQESGDCTSTVVFPDLQLSRQLPAHGRAVVEFTPTRAGRSSFGCAMNMVRGTLVVEPGGSDGAAALGDLPSEVRRQPPHGPRPEPPAGQASVDSQDEEAAARQAEIADLGRRVVAGALLTSRSTTTTPAAVPIAASGTYPNVARSSIPGS